MAKSKCSACVFRTGALRMYRCNYAWLTGRTRRGQPPEACTYFIAGERLDSPQEAAKFLARRKGSGAAAAGKPKQSERPKYDWAKAETMYRGGANDGEIAREIGAKPATVFQWRKRRGLPANARAGGLHGNRAVQK